VSGKLLGVGLLGVGAAVAVAAAGYLTVRSVPPSPVDAAATPVAALPQTPAMSSVPLDTPAEPVSAPKGADLTRARLQSMAAPQPAAAVPAGAEPVSAPAPAAVPVIAPATPPVTESPATPPPPPVAEPPRYVPDLPLPAAAVAEEPPRVIELEEVTVPKHSVIGIRLDEPVSTRTARVEDRVSATVSRDVTVGNRTAIRAGVRLEGTVVLVERGGRFKNRPRFGLRFDRMILTDGTRVSITTDTIYREGDSPSADATARVGASAVAGAIIGAVIGGKKGAAIGTAAGAAGGAATVMRGDPGETSLPGGTPLTVRLTEDVTMTISRQAPRP